MNKKLTIKESFNLGKGWNLMIFAILAMLVTNAGVNDGLNIALPEIAKGAGLDYELCLSMGTVAGFVGVAMMLVIAKFRDRFGGRKVSAALFIIFGFTFYFLFLRASNIVMYAINATVLPYVMEYNADSCPEKMVELAKAIQLPVSGNLDEDKLLLSKELLKLTKTLGIKTLSEQGIKEEDLSMLADDVLKEPVLGFNPKQGVTKEDVLDILRKAM